MSHQEVICPRIISMVDFLFRESGVIWLGFLPFTDTEVDNDSQFTSQEQKSQYRTPLYQPRQGSDQPSFGGSYRTNEAQDDEGNELKPKSYEELRKRHRESRMQGPRRLTKVPQHEVRGYLLAFICPFKQFLMSIPFIVEWSILSDDVYWAFFISPHSKFHIWYSIGYAISNT